VTPDFAPSWRAHMPAAFTTYSHSIVPWSVTTPATRPCRTITSVTVTPWAIVTPCWRAPFAIDIVTSTGFTRPSPAT
jgi:hypothetical protein